MKGVIKWLSSKSKRRLDGGSESDSDESCCSDRDDMEKNQKKQGAKVVQNEARASSDKEENFAENDIIRPEHLAAKLESAAAAEEDPLSKFHLYELVFAQHLGIDFDETHYLDLILLARDSMHVLPLGWELVFSEENGSEYGQMPYYFDGNTDESQWNHPFEDNYRRIVAERRNVLLNRDDNENDASNNNNKAAVHQQSSASIYGSSPSKSKKAQLISIDAVCKPAEDVNDVYIDPVLLNFVNCNSIQEVDSSLALLKELQLEPPASASPRRCPECCFRGGNCFSHLLLIQSCVLRSKSLCKNGVVKVDHN